MDGANADSDHSMTWEDIFGSTTDLTPTLIGIYDSLLVPVQPSRPEISTFETAKDARNNPPLHQAQEMIEGTKDSALKPQTSIPPKDPSKIAGSVKLPIATINKSSLYSIRTKSEQNGASDKCDLTSSDTSIIKIQRTFKESKNETSTFENLSPNVKRMISSATESTTLKFQKKTATVGRSSTRLRSNIPLVGATSKISQSGVEILSSVEIYDQPCGLKSVSKAKNEENESPLKDTKPKFKVDDIPTMYDVPTNNMPAIYDVPNLNNKTAFESLSLPYIDQSIELSITSNDREFDTKLSPKENSPIRPEPKTPKTSPVKYSKGTNSLHRKDFINKSDSPSKQLLKSGPYPEVIGSTGNLKSVPEKEVNRLNPSMEVPRPLSMSSIASSSSTSSSGVQNKGGVNSAYLASIESLDDHSDADITSTNGSNNFVNSTGMIPKTNALEERHLEVIQRQHAVDEMSGLSQLERVCAEIIQTENVYVEDLRQVVEGYLHVWRRDTTFSEDELTELFNNIEDIFVFNRSLCNELNSCRLDATCIARCFVNNTTGFSVYTSYCTGYPRTMERLAALASKSESAREFRERQDALGHPLPLASYLLKPVQRILKYHLLLQNVVKQCASSETEYALLKMTGIAQHIDEMKRRHEHAVRVQEIQSLLYGWNGPDLTTYGELCAEGTFRVFGAKAMRHAFLFDKMLLVTKNREDGILAYKSHIMCNNMMLVESIAGAPLSFHVIPWDAPRAQLTLQARSQRHKREWTLLLKRVILENYNAVIPSHARQLVMELGQNKTDDDIIAEKSHSLITQASMRKQLSAPEYLEKRKLERDRRKSFENGIRGRLKKANRKHTMPITRTISNQDCDCAQVSIDKGTDYTCDNCYIDLCSECETEISSKEKIKTDKCGCKNEENCDEQCPECDRSLHYIDAGSTEHLERKQSDCKCSDFKSSQESFGTEFGISLNKTRSYNSCDNIISYTDNKSKEDLSDANSSSHSRNINKTCLKCAKIKENIAVTDSTSTLHTRPSRCIDGQRHKTDTLRSKSKEDPQRSKLSKIGTWRRKSEPGLQQNSTGHLFKKTQDSDSEKNFSKGNEKIEFECRNCGSNKMTRKEKSKDALISDLEIDSGKRLIKPNIEVKMYNTKNVPKKISKLKKSRAKGLRLATDNTAKFYADFSTDVSTENILHISESNDSLNVDKKSNPQSLPLPETITKDDDIDEETYKKLIEKTDSFKKNELEKVKYLNKQKVINENSELEDKESDMKDEELHGSCEEVEQPLEQIISQLLMQNREFQKLLKKQQQRNSAQRRHQRLLKSHSNPEPVATKDEKEIQYFRQTSDHLDINDTQTIIEQKDLSLQSGNDDHIYETLRVEKNVEENLNCITPNSKATNKIQVTKPKELPTPPNVLNVTEDNECGIFESDYVYLSFDKLKTTADHDGIYDVPVKSPEKVQQTKCTDYYVTMENQGPATIFTDDNLYDSLIEVCRRKKEEPTLTGEYLPMSPDQQSPNTPEIWLSRQKEHFNVSRDRKSGSLPRSFQIIVNNQDENNLSTFKCKPNSNSKTYLNRDGKVLNIDRPFTIASDKSEISYDDVENYMSDGDILKFNKNSSSENEFIQDISQSTLELEEEIDRCYKNNFEKINLDNNKNEGLSVSQANLTTSITSSCEGIDKTSEAKDNKNKDVEVIHPEHKIYKPTTNILSLKNVLGRFKNRSPYRNNDELEINANEQSSPDSGKSDPKSPTSEKRSALNPRSYSKNLLQRFRNIIGDEHSDDNQNKTHTSPKASKVIEDTPNNLLKSEIKVVITSTDVSPTTSTIVYKIDNGALSRSICEQSTMSESQNEKNHLDVLSHSCDNITHKSVSSRPSYEKSVSLMTNISCSGGSTSSPSKSNNSSYQSLNKLPIYMQGSKHLGARIAQSDYVDPTTLTSEKSALKNINILINKNAVRPDSLFSNSSFVTSSSEGTYQEPQNKTNIQTIVHTKERVSEEKAKSSDSSAQNNSDESFYERSFEKIEQVFDEDVFRDSAVYSDQEEEESKIEPDSIKVGNKATTKAENLKRNSSFKTHKVIVTSTVSEKNTVHSKITFSANKFQQKTNTTNIEPRLQLNKIIKPKIAPPVPAKPKLTNIPSATAVQSQNKNKNLTHKEDLSSSDSNINTIKRNNNIKPTLARFQSTPTDKIKLEEKEKRKSLNHGTEITGDNEEENLNEVTQPGIIQMKRLSFERASLDSATRKVKISSEPKRSSIEQPKITTKSVQERRMQLEMMSKNQTPKQNINVKKPSQITKPKSITTKMATFERSTSENVRREIKVTKPTSSLDKSNIPSNEISINDSKIDIESDVRGSWVKQVVNKFQ